MDNSSLGILVPILAISVGLVAVVGHHVSNLFRMKHGYAPLNQNGKPDAAVPKEMQGQLTSLKADVDRLRGVEIEVERLKERIAILEKIATDPADRLSREIERLG